MDLALLLTECQKYFMFEIEYNFGKISTYWMSISVAQFSDDQINSGKNVRILTKIVHLLFEQVRLTGTKWTSHKRNQLKIPFKSLWSVLFANQWSFFKVWKESRFAAQTQIDQKRRMKWNWIFWSLKIVATLPAYILLLMQPRTLKLRFWKVRKI